LIRAGIGSAFSALIVWSDSPQVIASGFPRPVWFASLALGAVDPAHLAALVMFLLISSSGAATSADPQRCLIGGQRLR
jgi:hypothetical protein